MAQTKTSALPIGQTFYRPPTMRPVQSIRPGGRERGAPTSDDRVAAKDAWSCPSHERRSLGPSAAVSMVSIGPEDHHDHPARDPRALASGRLPSVLALEIPPPWRSTANRRGSARADPAD